MALPATDALSLATSPRRRSATRSPSPFSPPAKGVQGIITRQVMRRLSGLQAHEEDDSDVSVPNDLAEDDGEEIGVLEDDHQRGTSPSPTGAGGEVKKIDWEIPRKTLHSSIGFVTLYLYTSQGSPALVVKVLWSALAVIVSADALRLNYAPFASLYERLLGALMRESEKRAINGVVWYILGVNFALSVYPLDVAVVAILILSWADTAASTIGRLFGAATPRLPRRLLGLPLAPRKSLAGFVAASVTGAAVALGFWSWVAPVRPQDATWMWAGGVGGGAGAGWLGVGVLALVAGLVSGVAEALDLPLDDNLTLPIISGGCLLGFFKLLGLFAS